MKKPLLKLLAILGYICILLYFVDFRIFVLFDWKILLLTVAGAVLISLAHARKGLSWNEKLQIVGRNALVTSYIQTFVLLFARMSESEEYHNILSDIALNCRPVLYGFILYVLFQKEENFIKEKREEIKSRLETDCVLTASEIYHKFIEMGLTAREAEIARLIINSYSNLEIAEELCITENTVKKHVSNVFEKLKLSKREQLKTILQNQKEEHT